ncbi:hypothetical protein KTO58_14095 [Chitinophaga pendula]|uniref:hypothetical protein n=1 Tax=Chitinophaga TaxID=79328 RepID=UPI000BAEDA84|nr:MULTISPECIES: hypothetical protein [Chitinophaga]ASZ12126.1 hypothetical protein CK934_14740 [Chitinophaga sp. MD30]UCJ04835.1 hypothetical protein KTO58_14095 [Chitinophaga pendula]
MKKITGSFILLFLPSACLLAQSNIDTTHHVTTTKISLDLDGARTAYHPNNEGCDYNENGGINKEEATQNRFSKKRGYGIAKKRSEDGKYYIGFIQPSGHFVSQTTVYNRHKAESDPDRYADAEMIPYIALTPNWQKRGIKNCDIAYVKNLDNSRESAAIFADFSKNTDESKSEISLALANTLDIAVSKKNVSSYDGKKKVKKYTGIANNTLKIYYFVHSGDGNGKTPEEIRSIARRLMGK